MQPSFFANTTILKMSTNLPFAREGAFKVDIVFMISGDMVELIMGFGKLFIRLD